MKTKLVLCVISTFMIGKNLIEFEFDVYDRVLCDCEHCARLTKQEYKLRKKRFGTIGRAQKTYSHCMKSMIHDYIRF